MLLYSTALSGATITSNATGNWNVGGTWVGGVVPVSADNVIIAGGHTVTLTAGITRTGSLTVTGTLQLAGFSMTSGDLQDAGIITSSSGVPVLTTGSNNTSTTFSGVIGTGAIALTKNGTGTLTLSGSNTYTGVTTIAAGTLKLGNTTALGTTAGATSVTSGAVLDLNGINYSSTETLTLNGTGISTGGALINSNATGAAYAGNIALGGTAPRITANNPITLSGVISGTTDLTSAGTSVLTLSGANTNSGLNNISGGTLKLGNPAALGSVAAADWTWLNAGGVLDLNGLTTSTEFLRFNGGNLINSSGSTATYAGQIDIYVNTTTVTCDNPIIFSGVVAGNPTPGYTKNGTNTLKVTSDNNTRGYGIIINQGTLIVGTNGAIGSSTGNPVVVNGGAVLDLNGVNYTYAKILTLNGTGISGGGALINSSVTAATFGNTSSTITLGSASSVVGDAGTIAITGTITGATFGLTLGGAAGGSVTSIIGGAGTTVTKTDAGTWTLSGLNTYTGTTTVSAGILRATNNTIVASTNGAFGNNGSGLLLNGGTIQSNVATFSRPITVTATGSGLDAYGATRTISSTITNSTASSTFNINVGGTFVTSAEGQNLTLSGVISNSAGTLSLTKIGTSVLTLSAANTFLGGAILSAGQLNINHATAPGSGAFTMNGGIIDNTTAGSITLSNNNTQNWNGDFTFTGTRSLDMGTGAVTLSASRQITVSGNTLTVGGTINQSTLNLAKSGSGTLSFGSQTITLNNLTISSGILTATSGTLNLAGNFTNSATFTHNSGAVNFNGGSSQTIGGTTFNNLSIDNASGVTLSANVTYNATLTLGSGVIATGANTLIASSTGIVSRTNGHVYGNFQKNIATGVTSKTFEIGDVGNYAPITVDFASVTTAGNLTASTIAGDHPNIGSSVITATNTANRNWTLINSGIVFTTYDATFTFVAGDLDAGAATSNFIVGRYNAGWTYPTVGTKTSTSTQATGLTLFGDFQLGQALVTKIFTGIGNFSDATRWTSGTLPAIDDNLIIDGACTVDNNAGTDNVGYGTLTIGTATGRTLNWAPSGTNRLNVSNVSAGAGASALDMTNGGTMIIRGTWISTNLTFTPGTGTIEMLSTITLPAAYATYSNLTINGSGSTVSSGTVTAITGNVTISSGTFDANDFNLTIGGNWTNNSTFTAGTGTVTLNGSGAQTISGSSTTAFYDLTVTKAAGTATALVAFNVDNNLNLTQGVLTIESTSFYIFKNLSSASGTTFNQTPASPGAVYVTGDLAIDGTYNALYNCSVIMQNAGGVNNIRTGTCTGANVSGLIYNGISFLFFINGDYRATGATSCAAIAYMGNATAGTFETQGYTATFPITIINGGSLLVNAGGGGANGILNCTFPGWGIRVGYVNLGGSMSVASGCTVNASQINAGYDATNTGTISHSGGTVNTGDITIESGSSYTCSNSPSINVTGNWSNNGGTFTPASSLVEFSGTGAQTIGGSSVTTFNNLTVSGSGPKTLANNVNVGGLLTFTSGTITTGASSLYLNSTGTTSRTSGHVIGNFKKYVALGATSRTFEVGDNGGNYAPVTVAFASVTTAGDLTASVASLDHANIGTSTINPSESVNRNWTLTNSGIVFTNYSATFTFVAGDLDVGASTAALIVGKYSGGSWTYPNVGTKTSTTTETTGLTAFGDFQLGGLIGTKTFTGTGTFSTAARWTGLTVPSADENLVIDGTCTVDDNAGTDNVAYGTIIIGAATGRTLNWAAAGTNRLNVSNVSAGAGASTLDMTNGGTLIIRGAWTPANLTFTPGAGTIDVRGIMTLPAAYATYTNLIVTAASNTVTAGVAASVTNFSITSGTVDLNAFTLTTTGTATYTAGTINNGTVTSSGAVSTFTSTVFGAIVNATSNELYLNGSTFNNTTTLTKNGVTDMLSTGGNTFNNTTVIVNSSTGYLVLSNAAADVFNGNVTFTNTGTKALYVAFNSPGNQFNGNVTFNNTGAGSSILSSFGPGATATYSGNITLNNTSALGIYFGTIGGLTTLANTKTISIGGTGFATGNLALSSFTQSGTTAQVLTLTGTASLYLGPTSTFNGDVNFTSPQVYLNGASYNGTATITKNGATDNTSDGGNTFASTATISNSGTGWLALGNTTPDIFNGNTTFNNNSANSIYVALVSAGNQFNGDVTYNNLGSGSIFNYFGPTATVVYNGNIVVNNTSSVGGVYFGAIAGSSATLATTKTISIGGTGFATGTLYFSYFTQSGTTAQALSLTGTALLQIGPSATFNGNVNFVAPQVILNGSTFNGTTYIEKSGATQNNSLGANVFNGATTIANSGSGHFVLGFPTGVDIFNGDLTLINTGTAGIYPAYNTAGHQFNGNIILNLTAGVGIYFCGGTGTSTLATGKTVSVGGSGFSSGILGLLKFTQAGTTAQTLSLTGTASLHLGPSSTFNGNVSFVSPQVVLNGTTFNGTAYIEKNGATQNNSLGGNVFNGATTIANSGSDHFVLGFPTGVDIFNGDLTLTNTGTAGLYPAYNTAGHQFNGNIILSQTTGTAIYFCGGTGTATLATGKTISIGGLGFSGGTLILPGFTQTGATAQTFSLTGTALLQIGPSTTFNGNLSFTAPQLVLNGGTFNGTASFTKNGATDNTSDGGNIFNSTATITNSGTGYLRLSNITACDFNSDATFIQIGSGLLQPSYATNTTFAGDISTAGTGTAIIFGTGAGTVTLNGTGPQSITGSLPATFNNLIVADPGNTVTSAVSTVVNGNLTVTSGTFDVSAFSLVVTGDVTITGTMNANSANLTVGGNWINNGTFTANASTVQFIGASTQNMSGSSVTSFHNITVTNTASPGVSVQNNQNLLGVLTLAANVVFDADGTGNSSVFNLISTSDSPTQDAGIATLPSGAQVTGDVTVQRYMTIEGPNNTRIYRYISSPIQNAAVADIQGEIPIAGSFTGSSGGSSQSMFGYDESVITDSNGNGTADLGDGYTDFPNASNAETLLPGAGYAMFVRGNEIGSALWDVRGIITHGNVSPVSLPVTYTSSGAATEDGWNLIGNPFPSTIDWNAASGWTKNNMEATIYTRDNGVGNAQVATWNGTVGVNGGTRNIAAGQGFWVKADGGGVPLLEANENVKAAGTQTTFFREGAPDNLVRITMVKGVIRDEVVIHFRDDATAGFDKHADARKLSNSAFNLSSLLEDNNYLAINSLPPLGCNSTVKLSVDYAAPGSYQLQFSEFGSFQEPVSIMLLDNFTNTTFDVKSGGSYDFSVSTNPATYGAGRLEMTFTLPELQSDFLVSVSTTCDGSAMILIDNSQQGVTYMALSDHGLVSQPVSGNGETITLVIPGDSSTTGQNNVTIKAVWEDCSVGIEKSVQFNVVKKFEITSTEAGKSCREGVMTLQAGGAPEDGYYNWYESESSSLPLTGQHTSSFTTPSLLKSKTYYVSIVNSLNCEGLRKSILAEVVQFDDAEIRISGDSLQSNFANGNQWYFNHQIIPQATTQSILPGQPGTYSIEVSIDGCLTSADYEFVVTGDESPDSGIISVFPNPIVNEININIPDSYGKVEAVRVTNVVGQTIGVIKLQQKKNMQTGQFDMTNYPAGIYVLFAERIAIKVVKQ